MIYKNYYDISVAVSTPQGLLVPVVRDCEEKSMAQIEKDIVDLGTRARDGKIGLDELQGGTFTITNGGIFGSLNSTPILNTPQSGILGMHKIQQRAMVMPDGSIEARPMMYLALSYEDWCGVQRPEDTAICNGESTALQLIQTDFTVTGTCTQINNIFFDLRH